jgi:hypothetical protein
VLQVKSYYSFRWKLPLNPLDAPILSAERSYLFHWALLLLPLEAPIISTRGSYVLTPLGDHP